MATIERHDVCAKAMLGPPGKIPSSPDALSEAIRGHNNTPERSRNGSSTPNTVTSRLLKTKRSTNEITPVPALKGFTNGTLTRADQAVTSNLQTSVANIGRSTKPTLPVADLEYTRKRDRLLSLNFQASQEIALNEYEKFPEEYKEHVQKLSKYLEKEPPKFKEACYFMLMPCMGKSIGSTENSNTLVPYIRVMGLTTDQAIKTMNVLLSKSEVRKLYHPHIRICFDRSKLEASASDDASTVYGTPSTTLCGTLSVIKYGSIQRTVTIGGLIKVADRFYAITTSHIVPSTSHEPFRTSISLSDDTTIDENDYDDDVEPALVIERGPEESSSYDGESSSTFTSNPLPADVSSGYSTSLGPLEESGLEWSLIRIHKPWLQLPNFAANEDDLKTGVGSPPSDRSYISSVAERPSGMTVTVLAGVSGQVKARMLPNEAYTHLPSGNFVQTWTLSFKDGTGKQLGIT
ncbi:hypothetical protein N0V95_002019 [Ascochyta clinopodiicola]|nr:hypothetical protein N0V95_002019 [Ascochyta clinopodiicola]